MTSKTAGTKKTSPSSTQTSKRPTKGLPQLGVSACLAGERVRWNGGHKHDAFITGTLARFFHIIPVCPEVSIGLGVPREPIHLVRSGDTIELEGASKPVRRHSTAMRVFARSFAKENKGLCGFVLKKNSPSCGTEKVDLYTEGSKRLSKKGIGAFASDLVEELPLLPTIEETALGDPLKRDHFLAQVFAYYRLQSLIENGFTPTRLAEFHAQHHYALMAHNTKSLRKLTSLVENPKALKPKTLKDSYSKGFMELMAEPTTPKKHATVMESMVQSLHHKLDVSDRQELNKSIKDYKEGLIPRLVPLTLLRHHFRKDKGETITKQVYLDQTPAEMILRAGS